MDISELNQEIQLYTEEKRKQLKLLSKKWDDLSTEVPQKFMQLIKSGMKPKVERGSSGGRQINVNLSFEMNTDAAKAYLEKARVQIQDTSDGFKNTMTEMNEKLNYYYENHADPKEVSALIKVFVGYYDYISKAKIEISKQTISFDITEETKAKVNKWKKVDQELARIAEAARLGVSVDNLEKHKKYLDAKRRKNNAKTSAAIFAIIRSLNEISDYLDATHLIEEYTQDANKLKAEEEEAERQRLLEEERKRKEEQERLRREEEERIECLYNSCTDLMSQATTSADFENVVKSFEEIKGYKDVDALIRKCEEEIKEIKEKEHQARIQTLYDEALFAMEQNTKSSYKDALVLFGEIGDYKDSAQLVEQCKQSIIELEKLEEEARLQAEAEEKERKEKEEADKKAKIKKKKKIMKMISLASLFVILLTIFIPYYKEVIVPKTKYNNALKLVEQNQYDEAISIFIDLGNYSDSESKITETMYKKAHHLYEQKEYAKAAEIFDNISYADSYQWYKNSLIALAEEYYEAKEYQKAVDTLHPIKSSTEAKDLYNQYMYELGLFQFQEGLYKEGYETLMSIRKYKDAQDQAKELYYQQGLVFYDNKEYDLSNEIFKTLGSYKDSKILLHEHIYTDVVISVLTCEQNGVIERTCECGKVENVVTEAKGHQYSEVTCTQAAECSVCGHIKELARGHNIEKNKCLDCGLILIEPVIFSGSHASIEEDTYTIVVPKGTYNFKITTILNDTSTRWSIKVNNSEIYFGSSVTKKSGTFTQQKTILNDNTESNIVVRINGSYTLTIEPVNK